MMFKLMGEIESYRAGTSKKGSFWAFLKIKSRHINFGQLHTSEYEIFCPEEWPNYEKMQYATIEVPCAVSVDFATSTLKIQGLSSQGVEPKLLKAAPKNEDEYIEQQRKHYREMKLAEKADETKKAVDSKKAA
jgi:hypothetical protein